MRIVKKRKTIFKKQNVAFSFSNSRAIGHWYPAKWLLQSRHINNSKFILPLQHSLIFNCMNNKFILNQEELCLYIFNVYCTILACNS